MFQFKKYYFPFLNKKPVACNSHIKWTTTLAAGPRSDGEGGAAGWFAGAADTVGARGWRVARTVSSVARSGARGRPG